MVVVHLASSLDGAGWCTPVLCKRGWPCRGAGSTLLIGPLANLPVPVFAAVLTSAWVVRSAPLVPGGSGVVLTTLAALEVSAPWVPLLQPALQTLLGTWDSSVAVVALACAVVLIPSVLRLGGRGRTSQLVAAAGRTPATARHRTPWRIRMSGVPLVAALGGRTA